MLPRTHINPPSHWVTEPKLPYSQAVRCGELIFTTGQVALDTNLTVIAATDLRGQIHAAVDDLCGVLDAADTKPADLVHLRAFYIPTNALTSDEIMQWIGQCLGFLGAAGPAITLVPVEMLMSPGVLFEIEGVAMRGQRGQSLDRTAASDPHWYGLPSPFSHVLRVGQMLFTSGITARNRAGIVLSPGDLTGQSHAVLQRLDGLLRQLGGDIRDVVKTNVFNVELGNAQDWSAPALARASYYPEPGPAATGISLRTAEPRDVMIINDVIAMRCEDGQRMARSYVWPDNHWDWPVHLPYRHGIRCGDLVFLGGQVPLNQDASVAYKGDMAAQTELSMEYIRRVLHEFGLDFTHVVRINTFYATGDTGDADESLWKRNLHARFAHFVSPGPTTTGIPLPYLAYAEMNIEIDVIAMV